VFGNSTAGGAMPGMSDHVVMIDRSKVFLAGPPLVKMATGEEADDESLGGAEMHARVSGLATTSPSTNSTPSASAGASSPAQLANRAPPAPSSAHSPTRRAARHRPADLRIRSTPAR
jgi:acetyl-CoA carboxylase carboxyltransferase component